MSWNLHETVQLESPWDGPVDIDIEIAEWISMLWTAGVRTFFSCQGEVLEDRAQRPKTSYRPYEHPVLCKTYMACSYGYLVFLPKDRLLVRGAFVLRGWKTFDWQTPRVLADQTSRTSVVRFQRYADANVPAVR